MSRNRLFGVAAMQEQAAPVLPSRQKPVPSDMMKDDRYGGAAQVMSLPAANLIALLQDSGASVYARAKACQRLAVVGDKSAVPALAALLDSPQLSLYARTALETLPDGSADNALRAALEKVQGTLLAGVINSIGKRRDTNALAALERLRHHADAEVAGSANAALARIRPPL
jgi:hypothetical protein